MALMEKATSIVVRSLTPKRPHHAQWMITRKCNYRCRGCNVWQQQDEDELSTNEIKKGLDILRKLGIVEIVFSGGNPLLREDIGEVLDYASKYFITTVYDNGSTAAKKIDALRRADFVAISIDSLDPRKNDYIKGVPGAWGQAMHAVERLQREGIRVGVAPTISQINMYEILDITNWFIERNVPVWYSLYSYDTSAEENQLFRIGRRNDEFVITDRKSMVELCDSINRLKKRTGLVLMTDQVLNTTKTLYSENKRTWSCQALQNFLMVDHLGRVAGCHLHDPVASIFDLPTVWNSERLDAFRKKYSLCHGCTYLCYIFYSVHGTVLGNLRIARERWRSAPLLLKRTKARIPDPVI
jgi:MoaA/NifB/PqqE/SkfB family radical SAM enzyme